MSLRGTAYPLLGASALLALLATLPWFPEPIGSRSEVFREGAILTLQLTFVSGLVGLLLGMIAAAARLSSIKPLDLAARAYIWLFRGTPLLTQILFVYYAVPALIPALKLDPFLGAAVALSLNVAAYNAEAIRAGLLSVPKGQAEAAQCLGFTRRQRFFLVLLPQAARLAVPPLVSNLLALLKDSAMASSIGLLELTLAGSRVASETFQPAPVLLTVAAVYLVFTTAISLVVKATLTALRWEHVR